MISSPKKKETINLLIYPVPNSMAEQRRDTYRNKEKMESYPI